MTNGPDSRTDRDIAGPPLTSGLDPNAQVASDDAANYQVDDYDTHGSPQSDDDDDRWLPM